jgi:hypothetical protein
MQQHLSSQEISEILFVTDPMHTCCKENDCYDEYDAIANGVREYLVSGQALAAALRQALVDWFDEETVISADLVPAIQALEAGSPP